MQHAVYFITYFKMNFKHLDRTFWSAFIRWYHVLVCFYQMIDLVFFLIILMVFVLSYSISTYAIMFPNSVLRLSLIRQILRKGYWTLYGELFLDEYEGNTESSETRPPPMVFTCIVSQILFFKLKLMTMKLKIYLLVNSFILIFWFYWYWYTAYRFHSFNKGL